MPATKEREIRHSKQVGTISRKAARSAVQKVISAGEPRKPASYLTAPVLRPNK